MIHWLLQSLDDCPEILRGDGAPAWLGAAEQARRHSFKVEKRRRDWLLGRWTAKNLVQRYLAQTTGDAPALDSIFIGADADGAPYASWEGRGARREERLPVSLSISHSHGTAFCGLIENKGLGDWEIGDWRLGVVLQSPISNLPISQSPFLGCDIEFVEPREWSFVRGYFTAEEMAAVAQLRERDDTGAPTGFSRFLLSDADFNRREPDDAGALTRSDILTTAIWSGKEAVLKALREGLRIDTRRITCRFDPFDAPPQEWTPFAVIVDEGLAIQFPGAWSGWWRVMDQFVLTTAMLDDEERAAKP